MTPHIFDKLVAYYFPEPQASLFKGMILGIPLKTTGEFVNQLKIVGLTHLVVLSGSNISLLISIVGNITRDFSRRISLLITILSIVFFVVFVGPQAPIVRAAFTSIFTVVGNVYEHKTQSLYLLFLSLVCIAVIWPKWITSVSLQLSYGASLGLILFGSEKNESAHPKKNTSLIKTYLKEELRLSFAAQIFTTPIIFWNFKQLSLIAPISNLLVSWTVAPIMIFGIIILSVGSVNPYIGLIPAMACYGLLSYMIEIIKHLAQVPYVFFSW